MRALVAGLAVVPLLLAGCASVSSGTPIAGGSSPVSSGGSSAGAAPSGSLPTHGGAPDLASQLLTIDDVPSGWSIDNSGDSGDSSEPPCLRNSQAAEAPIHTERSFAAPDSIPSADQGITYYETQNRAVSRYASGVALLDKCTDVSFTADDGSKITGTIGRLSFPTVGERSAAYTLVFEAQGITLGMYIVAIQKGAEVETVFYADLNTPSLAEFATLVNKAVAKMPS